MGSVDWNNLMSADIGFEEGAIIVAKCYPGLCGY
jgi:hypothetical protein